MHPLPQREAIHSSADGPGGHASGAGGCHVEGLCRAGLTGSGLTSPPTMRRAQTCLDRCWDAGCRSRKHPLPVCVVDAMTLARLTTQDAGRERPHRGTDAPRGMQRRHLMESSPEDFAYSLSNFADVIFPCLDAIGARSVVEIGAMKGTTTRDLLEWAGPAGSRITAVDPAPHDELLALASERPELELVCDLSLDALERLGVPDAFLIDGDHNYYTLSHELALIYERAPDARMPLIFLHDVAWPLARRDQYAAPERIPAEHRHPYAHAVALAPGESGVVDAGLRYEWVACKEGGPRNGVLTAIEDFLEHHKCMQFSLIPAFFGLGVLWHESAPWAARVAEIVGPLDRNPLIQRLEDNRVAQLIARVVLGLELARERRARPRERIRSLMRRITGRAGRVRR